MNREISLISEMAVQTADTAETIRRRYSGTCVETESGTVLHYTDAENGTPVTLRLLPQDGCLRVEVCPEGMCLTEEEAHTLFYPDSQRIPLLIVKQIIRDFDALNNNPGLRLVAEEHMIWFQLITDKNGKLQSHHR